MGGSQYGHPAVIARLTYAYVGALFVLATLLFAASLLLHLSVFVTGTNEFYTRFGLLLFRATVIVGIAVMAFAKDERWKDQIKSCPQWMWKGALSLGAYTLLITCALTFVSRGTFSDQALILSAIPLAFYAIFVCLLHSVLWTDYLQQSEVVSRAVHSVVFVTLGMIIFLAYRAGYLHHPETS
jgi:hypothetical protein